MGDERVRDFQEFVKTEGVPEWEMPVGVVGTDLPSFTEVTPIAKQTTAEMQETAALKKTREFLAKADVREMKTFEKKGPWMPSIEAVKKATERNKPENQWDNPDNLLN